MRCKGGNGYYEYVKKVLSETAVPITAYKKIADYKLDVVDDIEKLFLILDEKNTEDGLSKVVTGPGWTKDQDIVIDGHVYNWANDKKGKSTDLSRTNNIYSIHKIQGFDLNYAGVIFGKEVFYNTDTCQIEINKRELKDNHTKSSGNLAMRQFIINIYITLMTRGISGTYVYAYDENLREYLKKFFC